jgi:hypothetical protein
MTFDANDAAGGGGSRRETLIPWSAQPPVEVAEATR